MDFFHRLKSAFIPQSVAVIGASDREGSRGTFIWNGVMNSRRIMEAYPVNPKYKYIGVNPCWATLAELPTKVDLAVIAVSSRRVMDILQQCKKLGIPNVLITPGDESVTTDRLWREKIIDFAKKSGIRLIGPDSIGIMRPSIGLNVSYWPELPRTGNVGLICQAGAVTAGVLDFARRESFGFSSVITSGIEGDVDLAESIGFLAADPQTHVIALHVESIRHPRRFYSAVRATSRIKPVIILKAGRGINAGRIVSAHLASPVGNEKVFDAMLSRASAVRTDKFEEFCASIALFATDKSIRHGRAAVLANSWGSAALAADALDAKGLTPAQFPVETAALLNAELPGTAQAVNPFILGDGASLERYCTALKPVLSEDAVDAVTLVIAPETQITDADIETLGAMARESFKPVCIVMLGGTMNAELRARFAAQSVLCFDTLDLVAGALKNRLTWERILELQLEVPNEGMEAGRWDISAARTIIEDARAHKKNQLTEAQTEELLSIYGIPTISGTAVSSPDDAVAVAKRIGYPVALKLSAEGVAHKSDVGGVALNLFTETAVRNAYDQIRQSCTDLAPYARFLGVIVQPMAGRANARELAVSVITDPALGPAIYVGAGGKIGEVFDDRTVDLPPLSEPLADYLVASNRTASSLGSFRGMPAVDRKALTKGLLCLSRLICDLPSVVELHINPLVADENGIVAIDATVSLCARESRPDDSYSHMLIAPYPAEVDEEFSVKGGLMRLRAIRPDDFNAYRRMLGRLSNTSSQARFLKPAQEISDQEVISYTQFDWERETAYVVVDNSYVGPEIHAIGRLFVPADEKTSEFGILVEDTYQQQGIGSILMEKLEARARICGCTSITGWVVRGNAGMVALMSSRGYVPADSPDDKDMIIYTLKLTQEKK